MSETKIIPTSDDADARADVRLAIEAIDGAAKASYETMVGLRGGGLHPQRHLACLASALITSLNSIFDQMYHSVNVERAQGDRQRFSVAINKLVTDECDFLRRKYDDGRYD